MILNAKQIEQYFNEWNKKAFNGVLPTPAFEITRAKRVFGQHIRTFIMGEKVHVIRISMFYDRPINEIIDTLVHEMLHYYIDYKDIYDSSSHGPVWRRYAKELNDKFGLNITKTSTTSGEANKSYLTKKQENKMEWVIVAETSAGNYGACVIPSKLKIIESFKKRMNMWDIIVRYKMMAVWGDSTFDLSHVRSRLSLSHISKERFQKLWDGDCIRLEAEGQRDGYLMKSVFNNN